MLAPVWIRIFLPVFFAATMRRGQRGEFIGELYEGAGAGCPAVG
jgi:hypothetical protein